MLGRFLFAVAISGCFAANVPSAGAQGMNAQQKPYPRIVLQNISLSPSGDGLYNGSGGFVLQRDASGVNNDSFYINIARVHSSDEFLAKVPQAIAALADDLKRAGDNFDRHNGQD